MRASTEDAGNLVPLDPQLPIFTPPKYGQMHKPKTMEDPVYGLQVSAIIRETKEFENWNMVAEALIGITIGLKFNDPNLRDLCLSLCER